MYVYMKCVLSNDFMQSVSPDLVHRRVELKGPTIILVLEQWFRQFYEFTLNYV